MSDDEDGEFPETGAGVGENDAVATGPEIEDDARDESPAPLHVREASNGGELREPDASLDAAQNMNPSSTVLAFTYHSTAAVR